MINLAAHETAGQLEKIRPDFSGLSDVALFPATLPFSPNLVVDADKATPKAGLAML